MLGDQTRAALRGDDLIAHLPQGVVREQTAKSVRDAAANVYTEDMDDEQWFQATVARLLGER